MFSSSDWLFAVLLIVEVTAFYYFYSHGAGVHAIYFTWFAWIIDVLAILSGCVIMSIAIFTEKNPYFFSGSVPFEFILAIYVTGSWQASIHAVKLYLRLFDHQRVKKMRAKYSKPKHL
jgi:hypothetical protein